MLYKVKSFRHVHQATKDIAAISEEVADCFKYSPCTHVSRDSWLVCKLKVINTNSNIEQDDDDPIKDFKDEAADSNGYVVIA